MKNNIDNTAEYRYFNVIISGNEFHDKMYISRIYYQYIFALH